MKKDLLLLLQVVLVILLLSCSESNKVTGGSIEDQNAISVEQLNEWYGYGTGLQESAYARIDGGKFAVAEDGSGARAECTADSSTLAMTIQIFESYAVSTLQGSGIVSSCDSSFSVFKISCLEKSKGQFFSISEGCKEGNFDAACRLNQVESDSISMLITHFSNVAANRCSEMSKNAQSLTGRYETLSSSSRERKGSSSSSVEPIVITSADTSVAINFSQTFKRYVLQYASSVEELSFDSHVVAYNGSASMECIYFMVNTLDSEDELIVKEIAKTDMAKCFPMTAKLMKEVAYESEEKCKYYATSVNDGAQPTGHVLSNVADNALEFKSVSSGGTCMATMNYFPVYFLLEDCEGEFATTSFTRKNQTFKSDIWKCESDSYSPSKTAASYGEWFNERLIPEGYVIDSSTAAAVPDRGTNSTYRSFKSQKETAYENLDQSQNSCIVNIYREDNALQQVKTFENGDSYLTVTLMSFHEGETQIVYMISGVYGGDKNLCMKGRDAFLNFCKQTDGFIDHSVVYIGLGCEEDGVLEMNCAANVPETTVDALVPELKEYCGSL